MSRLIAVLLAFGCSAISASAVETVVVQGITPTCVAVGSDGERSLSLSCLNQSLATADILHPRPVYGFHDVVGTGAPNRVGTFSFTGTSIRLGSSFGHSALSQRPSAPVFHSNVGGK